MKFCGRGINNTCTKKIENWQYGCCIHRKYDLTNNTINTDYITLPEELWLDIIYLLLNFKELAALAVTCKEHYRLVNISIERSPSYAMSTGWWQRRNHVDTRIPYPINKRFMLVEQPYDFNQLFYLSTSISSVTGKNIEAPTTPVQYVVININSLSALGELMRSVKNGRAARELFLLGKNRDALASEILKVLAN